jgi:hypothetical protein
MSDGITITIEKIITIERIKDLLCCAFEGGIDYWGFAKHINLDERDELKTEFYHERPAMGGSLTILDNETQEELGIIDMESMKKALQYMADGTDKNGKDCPGFKKHFDWILRENEDAGTGDIFVQLAVMGETVFG